MVITYLFSHIIRYKNSMLPVLSSFLLMTIIRILIVSINETLDKWVG